ncbi:hypothetical protein Dole_2712 [Desulfosudis oleivorans Hxd3]|uniref:Uncharacterized protein n=2 Tax=Desulfosudis TaxID=2904716 RepID=A8ZXD6_DESOH|nr:hypothetical protein Dole_2712 [Desulfosudis oleivorans Hxd3]
MGLIFGAHYYAGYGKIPKAFFLSAISGFPLIGLIVWIYCGRKANSELPVGEIDFKWGLAIISVVIQMVSSSILMKITGYA